MVLLGTTLSAFNHVTKAILGQSRVSKSSYSHLIFCTHAIESFQHSYHIPFRATEKSSIKIFSVRTPLNTGENVIRVSKCLIH
jgi:hypothetical protein